MYFSHLQVDNSCKLVRMCPKVRSRGTAKAARTPPSSSAEAPTPLTILLLAYAVVMFEKTMPRKKKGNIWSDASKKEAKFGVMRLRLETFSSRGTHVANSTNIWGFSLVSEEGIAKGVRRIVAVCQTGCRAGQWTDSYEHPTRAVAAANISNRVCPR